MRIDAESVARSVAAIRSCENVGGTIDASKMNESSVPSTKERRAGVPSVGSDEKLARHDAVALMSASFGKPADSVQCSNEPRGAAQLPLGTSRMTSSHHVWQFSLPHSS